MFGKLDLAKTIFIDLETAPEVHRLEDLREDLREYWIEKWRRIRPQQYARLYPDAGVTTPPDVTLEELAREAHEAWGLAGLFAEFGRVVCISLGRFTCYPYPDDQQEDAAMAPDERRFEVTSLYGDDEVALLKMAARVIDKYGREGPHRLCGGLKKALHPFEYTLVGHNIREFDVPYLCRRMMVNGLCLPQFIDCAGLKPWESRWLVDTLELWKFGDYKSYTKLSLLTTRFNIDSPKEEMDGSMVAEYTRLGRFEEIATYCAHDVVAVAQLLLRWRLEPLLGEDEITRRFSRVESPATPVLAP